MRKHSTVLCASFFVIPCLVTPASAGQQDDKALKKDLAAVIALQGMPCDEVVEAMVLAKDDYAVTCKDSHKYRVYQNSKGRVIVEKR